MPTIQTNACKLYYEIHGQGEPLIFIAGYQADHAIWANMIEPFAKHYQVILFDNRGVGQSDSPNTPYTIKMFVEDLVQLCKALDIQKAHFVGSSMGGAILQQLAYDYPGLIKSAVLNNTFRKLGIRSILQMKSQLAFREAGVKLEAILMNALPYGFSANYLAQPGMVQAILQLRLNNPYPITTQSVRNQLNALLAFDSNTWFGDITVPCLIIGADDDQIVPEKEFIAMAKQLPHAEYHCFKEIGHIPHIEATKQFCDLVLAFLKKYRS